jgi:hypothetical protein
MDALKDAKHEARCMDLDLRDAVDAKGSKERLQHLQAAIRRHALIADRLREALTIMERQRGTISMSYPKNLGGGHGPDRLPLTVAQHRARSMMQTTAPTEPAVF